MSMGTRQRLLALTFALLALGCDGDRSTTCPGAMTKRCRWNEATGQFDRACTYQCALPTDAGGD
jgi:hypothetical protein